MAKWHSLWDSVVAWMWKKIKDFHLDWDNWKQEIANK